MTPVIPAAPVDLYSRSVQEQVPAKPLVFACSGCSFAGKLADDLARRLDRNGDAEMSCLAGIGAKRPSFIAKLTNREVWVIDGCPIECARGVFEQAGRRAAITRHIRLHDHGVKKHQVPNGEVDVDGFAVQLTEQVESRS
jgi:uncharacterized metal-binding protein